MVSKLWVRWWAALSLFAFFHLVYFNFEQGLVEGDRNIVWYAFLAALDMCMGLTLLIFKFKPFSSAIAWVCLASAIVNMIYGTFHVFSHLSPLWLDATMIELYGRITLMILGVQLIGFLLAGEQIGRYNGNNNNSVFSLYVEENNQHNARHLGQ